MLELHFSIEAVGGAEGVGRVEVTERVKSRMYRNCKRSIRSSAPRKSMNASYIETDTSYIGMRTSG